MTKELEEIAETIKKNPDMNHHFAERLALLAKQMRDDWERRNKTRKP
jgi:alpha/beta superfamily hydrolase